MFCLSFPDIENHVRLNRWIRETGSVFALLWRNLNVLNHNKQQVLRGCHHDLMLFVPDPHETELILGVQFSYRGIGHFYEIPIVRCVAFGGGDVHIWADCKTLTVCEHQSCYTRVSLDAPEYTINFCSGNWWLKSLNVKVVHCSEILQEKKWRAGWNCSTHHHNHSQPQSLQFRISIYQYFNIYNTVGYEENCQYLRFFQVLSF